MRLFVRQRCHLFWLLGLALTLACSGGGGKKGGGVDLTISRFEPTQGAVGAEVKIFGGGFEEAEGLTVFFANQPAAFVSEADAARTRFGPIGVGTGTTETGEAPSEGPVEPATPAPTETHLTVQVPQLPLGTVMVKLIDEKGRESEAKAFTVVPPSVGLDDTTVGDGTKTTGDDDDDDNDDETAGTPPPPPDDWSATTLNAIPATVYVFPAAEIEGADVTEYTVTAQWTVGTSTPDQLKIYQQDGPAAPFNLVHVINEAGELSGGERPVIFFLRADERNLLTTADLQLTKGIKLEVIKGGEVVGERITQIPFQNGIATHPFTVTVGPTNAERNQNLRPKEGYAPRPVTIEWADFDTSFYDEICFTIPEPQGSPPVPPMGLTGCAGNRCLHGNSCFNVDQFFRSGGHPQTGVICGGGGDLSTYTVTGDKWLFCDEASEELLSPGGGYRCKEHAVDLGPGPATMVREWLPTPENPNPVYYGWGMTDVLDLGPGWADLITDIVLDGEEEESGPIVGPWSCFTAPSSDVVPLEQRQFTPYANTLVQYHVKKDTLILDPNQVAINLQYFEPRIGKFTAARATDEDTLKRFTYGSGQNQVTSTTNVIRVEYDIKYATEVLLVAAGGRPYSQETIKLPLLAARLAATPLPHEEIGRASGVWSLSPNAPINDQLNDYFEGGDASARLTPEEGVLTRLARLFLIGDLFAGSSSPGDEEIEEAVVPYTGTLYRLHGIYPGGIGGLQLASFPRRPTEQSFAWLPKVVPIGVAFAGSSSPDEETVEEAAEEAVVAGGAILLSEYGHAKGTKNNHKALYFQIWDCHDCRFALIAMGEGGHFTTLVNLANLADQTDGAAKAEIPAPNLSQFINKPESAIFGPTMANLTSADVRLLHVDPESVALQYTGSFEEVDEPETEIVADGVKLKGKFRYAGSPFGFRVKGRDYLGREFGWVARSASVTPLPITFDCSNPSDCFNDDSSSKYYLNITLKAKVEGYTGGPWPYKQLAIYTNGPDCRVQASSPNDTCLPGTASIGGAEMRCADVNHHSGQNDLEVVFRHYGIDCNVFHAVPIGLNGAAVMAQVKTVSKVPTLQFSWWKSNEVTAPGAGGGTGDDCHTHESCSWGDCDSWIADVRFLYRAKGRWVKDIDCSCNNGTKSGTLVGSLNPNDQICFGYEESDIHENRNCAGEKSFQVDWSGNTQSINFECHCTATGAAGQQPIREDLDLTYTKGSGDCVM